MAVAYVASIYVLRDLAQAIHLYCKLKSIFLCATQHKTASHNSRSFLVQILTCATLKMVHSIIIPINLSKSNKINSSLMFISFGVLPFYNVKSSFNKIMTTFKSKWSMRFCHNLIQFLMNASNYRILIFGRNISMIATFLISLLTIILTSITASFFKTSTTLEDKLSRRP